GISVNSLIKNAFDIIPNTMLEFSYTNEKGISVVEKWESYTDAYNQKYIYCNETDSSAYYVNDGSMFYFTGFYGNKKSLLYYFYLSAYRVFLGDIESDSISDAMSLSTIKNNRMISWLHDFIAPFYHFIKLTYTSNMVSKDNLFDTLNLVMESNINLSIFGFKNNESNSTVTLHNNKIVAFTFKSLKTTIEATCLKS
ncbi:MAG: hypothetical protein ACOYM7_12430, partial [Paludibacter sp.]